MKFIALSLFAFVLFFAALGAPETAEAYCDTICSTVADPPFDVCYEGSEGQTYCQTQQNVYDVCSEVCVDVNNYSEEREAGNGFAGDYCAFGYEKACFSKTDVDISIGRGDISFYVNSFTSREVCDSEGQCYNERLSENREWDSCSIPGAGSDCRYNGDTYNTDYENRDFWGYGPQNEWEQWWPFINCPFNDWACARQSGGGGGDEWWGGGGGGGGGGWGPPPPPPASVDLRVNGVDSLGSPVEFPNSFTLSWTTANADSCSADGSWSGGKFTSGSEEFSGLSRGTYSYTLNCSGPGGSGSDSVSVQVVQVPRCSLSANPTQIVRPQQSVLSWSCQYADSCSIDNGVGSVNPVSGTTNVSPIQSTLYSLTCSGLDGSRSFSTLVSVFVSGLKEVLPR